MNEEYNLSQKMKGRQLLKIIYSKKILTDDFKEICLITLNDNDDVIKELNDELSYQHTTFHPDYGSICSERPLIDYRRGISINDMELEVGDKECLDALALDITNRIRMKVRKSLMKSYRKSMKQSDLLAIEKALFQYYDENFVDVFLDEFDIDIPDDDASELDEIFGNRNSVDDNWGEPIDFSIEEILDMPVMGDEIDEPKLSVGKEQNPNYSNIADNKSYDNSNHGIFCVTGKDLECVDLDDLY